MTRPMWKPFNMLLAFVIAAVALVVLTVAWGSTMDLGTKEIRKPRRPRHTRRVA
jgi:hypothetical protein